MENLRKDLKDNGREFIYIYIYIYIYIKQTNYAYGEFIRRHDTAEERVSVLNDGSKKLSRLKCEGKKD